MFKRLKDRLVEEVNNARLPPFAQNLVPQDLLDLGSDGASNGSPVKAPSQVRDQQQFSLLDEDDLSEQNPPREQLSSFETVDLSDPTLASTPKKSPVETDLTTTDEDSLLPTYTPPSGPMRSYQSDVESASEVEEPKLTLEKISKEQLYQFFVKSRTRYQKYKSKYGEVVEAYKQQMEEKDKIKNILSESQDKALRRIAELKEEAQLAIAAKTDMEGNFRLMLEEKDEQIQVLHTQVRLLKDNTLSCEISSGNRETPLIDLSVGKEHEMDDQRNEALAAATLQVQHLQAQLEQLRSREQESASSVAEMKRSLHEQLRAKERELIQVSTRVDELMTDKAMLEAKVLKKKEIIKKVDEQRQKEIVELKEQLVQAENVMEQEKQSLVQDLSRAKAASVDLLKEQMEKEVKKLKHDHNVELKELLHKQEEVKKEAQEEIKVLKEQCSESKRMFVEKVNTISMQEAKLEELGGHVIQLQQEKQVLHQQVETLRSKLDKEVENYQQLKGKDETEVETLKKLELENSDLKKELDRSDLELQELKVLKSAFQPVLAKLRKQHKNISNLKEINHQNLAEIRTLNAELSSCKLKIDDALSRLLILHEEKDDIISSFERRVDDDRLEMEELKDEVRKLTLANDDLNASIKQLTEDKESIQNYLDSCQEFAGRQFEEYKGQVTRLEMLVGQLEGDKQCFVLTLQDKDILLSQVNAELQGVRSEHEKQHKQLHEATTQCDTAKGNLAALQHQLKEKMKVQQTLEETSSNSEKDLRELTLRLDATLDEKQTLSMLMEQMEKDAQDHEARLRDRAEELDEAAAEVASLKEQIATELQFRKQLQGQLHESHRKTADRDNVIADLQMQRDELSALYDDVQAKMKEVDADVSDHMQAMRSGETQMRLELENLRGELEGGKTLHRTEVDKLRVELDNVFRDLQAVLQEKTELTNALNVVRTELARAEASAETDKKNFDELKQEVQRQTRKAELLWQCLSKVSSDLNIRFSNTLDCVESESTRPELAVDLNEVGIACSEYVEERERLTNEQRTRIEELEKRVDSLRTAHAAQMHDIVDRAKEMIFGLKREFASLVGDTKAQTIHFHRYRAETETKLSETLRILVEELRHKDIVVDEQRQAMIRQQQELNSLKDEQTADVQKINIVQQEQLERSLRESEEMCERLLQEMEVLRNEVSSLKNELDVAKETNLELESIRKQQDVDVKEIQSRLEVAQQELDAESSKHQDVVDRLETRRESLLISEKLQRVHMLTEEIKDLKVLETRCEDLKADSESLSANLERSDRERQRLNELLIIAKEDSLKCRDVLRSVLDELSNLKSDLSFSQGLLSLHSTSMQENTRQIWNALNEWLSSQRSAEELTTEVKKQLLQSECENERLLRDNEALRLDGAELEKKLAAMADTHAKELDERGNKMSEDMQSKLNDLKKKAEAKLSQIKKQLQAAKDDEVLQFRNENDELRRTLATLQTERTVENTEDENIDLKTRLESLQDESERNRRTLLENEESAAKLAKDYAELKSTCVDAEEKYLSLVKGLRKLREHLSLSSSGDDPEALPSDTVDVETGDNSAEPSSEVLATESRHDEICVLEKAIDELVHRHREEKAELVKEINLKNAQIDESLFVAEETRNGVEKKYETLKQENKKLAANLLKKEELVAKLKTQLSSNDASSKSVLDESKAETSSLANDAATDDATKIQHLEEIHVVKIKQLAQEFSAQMEAREREFQEELAEAIGKEQQEKEHYIIEYKTLVNELQRNLREKETVAETVSQELQDKHVEAEEELRKRVEEFEQRMASQESNSSSKLNEVESKWKNALKQQETQLYRRHEEEVSGLAEEWKRERVTEENCDLRSSMELEKENRLTLAAMESSNETNELLRKQILALNCELASLKEKHQGEIGELRHLLHTVDANANQGVTAATAAARLDTYDLLGPLLGEPTEMEYLRNILYHYMMGRETTTLAKVIAAVVKFNSEQTQEILEREEARNTMLSSLLKPT